jgi:hypothetical protein
MNADNAINCITYLLIGVAIGIAITLTAMIHEPLPMINLLNWLQGYGWHAWLA